LPVSLIFLCLASLSSAEDEKAALFSRNSFLSSALKSFSVHFFFSDVQGRGGGSCSAVGPLFSLLRRGRAVLFLLRDLTILPPFLALIFSPFFCLMLRKLQNTFFFKRFIPRVPVGEIFFFPDQPAALVPSFRYLLFLRDDQTTRSFSILCFFPSPSRRFRILPPSFFPTCFILSHSFLCLQSQRPVFFYPYLFT